MNWLVARSYDWIMRDAEAACLQDWRGTLLSGLRGHVVEIGAGTGASVALYPATVERLTLIEPCRNMLPFLEDRLAANDKRITVHIADAEALPLDDASADFVVFMFVLCSVRDPARSLAEAWRVLRPGGGLVFLEHVAAEQGSMRLRWQRWAEPVWMRVAGNCHLTRHTEQAIRGAGFVLDSVDHESIRKVLPLVRPSIRGHAHKPDLTV